jgi:hypothetical protein
LCHIAANRDRGCAQVPLRSVESLRIAPKDRDVGAAPHQFMGSGKTNAAVAAGDCVAFASYWFHSFFPFFSLHGKR